MYWAISKRRRINWNGDISIRLLDSFAWVLQTRVLSHKVKYKATI